MKKRRASKRESLHHKYKVERKIREAVRQKRKDARKHPQRGLKKDPGIPNLLPFKEEIIQKLEAKKARMEEDKERQKKQRLAEAKKRRQMSMTELQNDASMKSQEYELKQKQKVAEENAPNAGIKDGSRKAYYKEFKKVITAADVILEVLDARDPMGCRCPEVEKMILRDPSKKIILVLNKIDLVPKDIVEQWLKHLRQQFPTIAFKCNTQIQKQNKGQITGKTNSASSKQLQSSQCLGAETLLQLLKNYARNKDIKTAVTVGIVGYPNVGKSSLINSLKRARAAPVGATPGFTKTAQEVHIDKHVKLLDSPGIVFADSMDNELILRNCVKLEQIEDPVAPVELIIKRCPKEQLLEIYSIADFKDNTEFLTHIAMKRGKLAKGGVPDWKAASRTVLQDWNGGRIPFYTLPPENSSDFIVSTEVVSSWGKEFDIDSVIMSEKSIIETLPTMEGVTYTAMPSTGSIKPDEGLFRHLQNEEAKRNKKLNANAMEDDEDDGDYDDAEEMDEVDEDEDEEDGDSEEDGDEDEDGSDDDEIDDMRLEAYIPTGAKSNVPTPVFSKSKAKQQLLKQAKTKSQDLADPEDLINPQRNKNLKKTQKQLKKLKAKSKSTPSGPGTDNYDFSTDFYADDKDGDIEL